VQSSGYEKMRNHKSLSEPFHKPASKRAIESLVQTGIWSAAASEARRRFGWSCFNLVPPIFQRQHTPRISINFNVTGNLR
jgi:hypothetical protein